MQFIALKFLGPIGTKIAGTLALGGVAAIGAEVAERTGIVDRIAGGVMHLAGLPDRPKAAAAALPSVPAKVGEAVALGAAVQHYCPVCATGPAKSGIGEAMEVKPHAACVERVETSAKSNIAVYAGWASSRGIDPLDARAPMPTIGDAGMVTPIGVPDLPRLTTALRDWQLYAANLGAVEIGLSTTAECGEYPTINSPGMRDPQFGTPNYGMLSTAQSKWNECAKKVKKTNETIDAAAMKAKKAAEAAAAAASAAATKAQKMAAGFALAKQQKKYEDEIAAQKAAQAAAADIAQKAEIQKQIDTLQAQKDQATALAEQLRAAQQAQQTQAQQAQIDALTREIAEKGRSPGGMDQYMQMLLMQRLAAPPAAPAQAPWVDPMMAPQYQQPVYAAPPVYAQQQPQQVIVIDPSAGYDGGYGFDEGYGLMGADPSTPLDADTAKELGLAGAETIGDALLLSDYRDAYGDEADELITDISGCMLGSCGLGNSTTQV